MPFKRRWLPLTVCELVLRSIFSTNQILALYNAFLAPNAPCELNIDHTLRNNLALCMVRPLGNEDTMLRNLQEVVELFELAQNSVYKLMSSVCRPANVIHFAHG
jgi:Regulator of G protein signaling domain